MFTLEQATKAHRGGGLMYSSTPSSTSTLGGVGGQRHDPAVLPPEKIRYPLCTRLGGPVWTGAENLVPHRDSIRGPSSP